MSRRCAVLLALVAACSGSPETPPAPAPGGEGEPQATPVAPAPAVADAGALVVAPPPVDVSSCAADSDCAFADPCMPSRCVTAASVPQSPGCDESAPATGTCVCYEKRCSLKPGPSHPVVAVDSDCTYVPGCVLDRATGGCAPGRDDDFRADRSVGPRCDCDSKVPQRCHFSWLDPIECKTVDDCWVDPAPFSHPIARPKKLRGKTFRPCKDGEVAPACADGRCAMRAYGC
ncbi:MAG TPA: hypothetical protein VMZ28_16330 [Kofleriaceae bacterium]|nr:hypothetical protein [Kofleriaceae bacterium]